MMYTMQEAQHILPPVIAAKLQEIANQIGLEPRNEQGISYAPSFFALVSSVTYRTSAYCRFSHRHECWLYTGGTMWVHVLPNRRETYEDEELLLEPASALPIEERVSGATAWIIERSGFDLAVYTGKVVR